MTESEWLACTSPDLMLEFLRGKTSDRKLRLFACDCCRRIWHLLKDERSRKVVETIELYADGLVGADELNAAAQEARGAVKAATDPIAWAAAVAAWDAAAAKEPLWGAAVTAAATAEAARAASSENHAEVHHCVYLRDIVGNPFRRVSINTAWLQWNNGSVAALARSIYNERTFGDLPLLGEALQQAGCNNESLLEHCRSQQEHVKGCWVVDVILGKE